MRLCFDPGLIERVVFLAAQRAATAGDTRLERALHQRIDPLYEVDGGREREAAFRDAYAAEFTAANRGAPLEALVAEQPLIEQRISQCVVRAAVRKRDESAEMFVKPNGDDPARTLVLALRPETLLDANGLTRVFRHEFQHVADMLDEQFAYDPANWPAPPSRELGNLMRDRFTVLWDCYIDGRLTRRGHVDEGVREYRAKQFAKVFPQAQAGNDSAAFEKIWLGEGLGYGDLVRWATPTHRE